MSGAVSTQQHQEQASSPGESGRTASWYVVETHPRAERLAQIHLDRQRFANFCPRFRKTRRHARRLDEVIAPAFPGYLFVAFDRDRDNWTAINGTRGVRRVLGPQINRPQAMPEAAMQALFARCEGELISSLCPTFAQGQRVRVLTGPFAELFAEIDHLDQRGRVRVLLDILGGRAPLSLGIGAVAPIEA